MTGTLAELPGRINSREAVLGVVGLGYVGLPVACLFASKGFHVIGVDRDGDRIALLRVGRCPIETNEPGLAALLTDVISTGQMQPTTDASALADADVITVSVETPVGTGHRPEYASLRKACTTIGEVAKDGVVVVIESTIGPGTMDQIVRPSLESTPSGRKRFLGHCPERVMPGKLLSNLATMSRVIGAESPEVGSVLEVLYSQIVQADLDVADLLTAELVKTGENAYRDVNIAFANELALICEEVGGDVWKVRELINKSPGRNVLFPGGGVGGHCIPKDPWLLLSSPPSGESASVVAAARMLNDGMPARVAKLTLDCLGELDVEPKDATVAVLGFAYLEDSDDTRNSPTDGLLAELRPLGCRMRIHDPFVAEYRSDALECLTGADCAVVMVAHTEYRKLNLQQAGVVMRHRGLVDARAVFDPGELREAGFTFRRLGVGASRTAW